MSGSLRSVNNRLSVRSLAQGVPLVCCLVCWSATVSQTNQSTRETQRNAVAMLALHLPVLFICIRPVAGLCEDHLEPASIFTWFFLPSSFVLPVACCVVCCGRLTFVADMRSMHGGKRSYAERQSVNTVIQGSASDIMKNAMLRIHAKLELYAERRKDNPKARPVLLCSVIHFLVPSFMLACSFAVAESANRDAAA